MIKIVSVLLFGLCFVLTAYGQVKVQLPGIYKRNEIAKCQSEFSNIKNELYVTSDHRYMMVVDLETGYMKKFLLKDTTYEAPYRALSNICLLGDSGLFVDNDLHVCKLENYEVIQEIPYLRGYPGGLTFEFGFNKKANKLCYSPYITYGLPSDAKMMNTVYLYDFNTNTADSLAFEDEISSFACDNTSENVYFTSIYGRVFSYNLLTNAVTPLHQYIQEWTLDIEVSADGKYLYGRSRTLEYIFIYDVVQKQVVNKLPIDTYIDTDKISMSIGNKYLAANSSNGITLYNLKTNTKKEIDLHFSAEQLSFIDSTRLLIEESSFKGQTNILDVESLETLFICPSTAPYNLGIYSSSALITVNNDKMGSIVSKDLVTGKTNWQYFDGDIGYNIDGDPIEISDDEKYLIYLSIPSPLFVFDNTNGNLIKKLDMSTEGYMFEDIQFISNTEFLIAGKKGFITKYNIETGEQDISYIKLPTPSTIAFRIFKHKDGLRVMLADTNYVEKIYKLDMQTEELQEIGMLEDIKSSYYQKFRYMYDKEIIIYSTWGASGTEVLIKNFDQDSVYNFGKRYVDTNYDFLSDTTALISTSEGMEIYDFYDNETIGLIDFSTLYFHTKDITYRTYSVYLKKQANGMFVHTDKNGCLYVFDLIQTSTKEPIVFNSSDKLYPNPVSNNTITIEHDTEIPELDLISICDVSGKGVTNFTFNHTGSETEIYLGEIPKGVYFISYAANGSLYSHKFVVK